MTLPITFTEWLNILLPYFGGLIGLGIIKELWGIYAQMKAYKEFKQQTILLQNILSILNTKSIKRTKPTNKVCICKENNH